MCDTIQIEYINAKIGLNGECQLDFQINKQIGVPLYIQIKDEIIRQVRQKEIKPGEKMPTERALANMLSTSRNTVSTAYRQLEAEGILESHQGRGTFVVGDDKVSREAHLRENLHEVISVNSN